jgi:hypothetical protein
MDKQEAMDQLKEFAEKVQLGLLSIEAANPYIAKSYLWDWEHTVVDAIKALGQKDAEEAAYNEELAGALKSIAMSINKGTLTIMRGNHADAGKLKVAILAVLLGAAEQLERR